jgi:hypothetical protein
VNVRITYRARLAVNRRSVASIVWSRAREASIARSTHPASIHPRVRMTIPPSALSPCVTMKRVDCSIRFFVEDHGPLE